MRAAVLLYDIMSYAYSSTLQLFLVINKKRQSIVLVALYINRHAITQQIALDLEQEEKGD